MTTIGEIVSRLRNGIKEQTDDSVYTNRYLWSTFFTIAKQLVKQDADNGRIYAMSDIWEPLCIEMEPISSIYCDCIPLPTNCHIYRSKKKLPKFLESSDGFVYRWIATPDLSRRLVFVTPYQYSVKSKIKYNRDKYAFLHNGYLFTPSETYPLLSVSGLFYGNLDEYKCGVDSLDEPSQGQCGSKLREKIQLPGYLENAAIKMALAELLPTVQLPFDEVPNGSTNQKQISL